MQNIKKYFMTLALLLTAVGGAWAQSSPKVYTTQVTVDDLQVGDILAQGFSLVNKESEKGFYFDKNRYKLNGSISSDDWHDLISDITSYGENCTISIRSTGHPDNVFTPVDENGNDGNAWVVTKIDNGKPYISGITFEITEWDLTSQDGKAWTLTKMPASGIELQVEYFAESNLFLGKEALADKANIAVKNGETAVAFDDAGKSTTTVSESNKVTATYTGTRKVKSVKAVNKAASLIVNPVVGQVIGSDGKNYDATATLPDGVTKVAVIAYVGNDTNDATFKNGLAIALADESGSMNLSTAKSTCEGKTAITGAKWFLPSQDQWKQMFKANGGNDASYTGLNTTITNAGGTTLQGGAYYWSSSESLPGEAYIAILNNGNTNWIGVDENGDRQVRACLAFSDPEVTWDAKTQTGSFTMPVYDVELQVEYYPESNIFLSKEALADKANIAVKNAETAVAFDDEGKSTTTVSESNKVTATYSGTKKVIGMTVTKRVSLVYPIVISEVTDEAYIGSVVAADGYVYATEDDVVNDSKTPVAKICYVGSETGDATYKHGLALALRDVSDIKVWCSKSNNCLVSQYTTVAEAKGDLAGIANTDVLVGTTPHSHGDNAAKAARGYNSGTHPDGTSEWFLPSVGQWDKMATAVGDYGKLGLNSGNYWSSTEIDADNAWSVNGGSWSNDKKYYNQGIRACLAF